jgi:predicted RNA-binding Zn ribbon-like protein
MVIFEMIGGSVCLDFANTASQRRVGPFIDRLHSYQDLLNWGVQADQLTETEASQLALEAARNPSEAEAVLERGRALREAIYRVFTARAAGDVLPPDDLLLISNEYARATAHRVLAPAASGMIDFEWRDDSALDRVLWPVAVSAAVLASSEEAVRVKECATDNCNWLFLDASKNRSRRWCEMKECGNRAKARRHYHRHRKS